MIIVTTVGIKVQHQLSNMADVLISLIKYCE
jgi:hypothetical protein